MFGGGALVVDVLMFVVFVAYSFAPCMPLVQADGDKDELVDTLVRIIKFQVGLRSFSSCFSVSSCFLAFFA